MANIQNDYTMNSYGEDEEERRRRRLEQEAAAAAAGNTTNWSDIPGQLLDKKLTDFQNRMDNVSQFATDPEAAIRQRLFDEKPTPVKQTITTDPETGAQTMKIEGSVQDLSAANTMTPTVVAPVAPAMGLGGAGKPGETAVGGTDPTPDQTEQQRRADGLRAMMSGAGTQVAGPVPTPAAAPVAAPVAPTQTFAEDVAARKAAQPSLGAQPVAPTSVVPVNAVTQITPTGAAMVAAPAPAPSLAQAGAQTLVAPAAAAPAAAEPAWVAAANAAGGDLIKLFDVAAKHPEARVAIQEKMLASMEGRNKEQEARKFVEAAASGDPKAMNKLEQALRPDKGKQKEEVTVNDYLKAYMYQRLGLNELAADVQKKIIGKESKFGQVSLGDSVWKTETNSQGEIIRAWDNENTPATKSTLAKLSASGQKFGGQPFSSTGGSQVIPAGQPDAGQEYRTVFNSTSGRFENQIITGQNAGKPYTGPAGVDKSVFTQMAKMDYGTISKYREKFGEDKLAALNQARKDGAINSPADEAQFLDKWEFTKGVPGFGQAQDPNLLVRAKNDVDAATRELATLNRLPNSDPTKQQRIQTVTAERDKAQQTVKNAGGTVTTTTTTTPSVSSGVAIREPGESETVFNQRKEKLAKEQDAARTVQTNLEELKNKVRTSMPASEGNVTRILTTLNDIATHPGLDKTIGYPDVLNSPLSMIPQSDRRAFKQKYNQLSGQEFLAAYNELRGGGSISETEGAKAEQAISALKDTGISPAEFKKNMWILQDAVKTGFDRQRELIGLPPKYRESPLREEAKAWLRANPNSPKAEAARKMLAGF
jgi:hypothetical protein